MPIAPIFFMIQRKTRQGHGVQWRVAETLWKQEDFKLEKVFRIWRDDEGPADGKCFEDICDTIWFGIL